MSESTLQRTISLLVPFLWPKNRRDLKIRVIFALFSMIIAKIASVYTPLILGKAVDSLTDLSSGINLLLYVVLSSYGGYCSRHFYCIMKMSFFFLKCLSSCYKVLCAL